MEEDSTLYEDASYLNNEWACSEKKRGQVSQVHGPSGENTMVNANSHDEPEVKELPEKWKMNTDSVYPLGTELSC